MKLLLILINFQVFVQYPFIEELSKIYNIWTFYQILGVHLSLSNQIYTIRLHVTFLYYRITMYIYMK